ncbi:MAG: adenylate/guanylate cyclase domain-containing protein [Spirochaetia bacterium]|nr:adenylate/guanylate cyclase domain-containing protein [Spirochaetia bacterium]
MSSFLKGLTQMRCEMDRNSMTPEVRAILDVEEANGARVGNRFRYGLGILICVSVLVNAKTPEQFIANSIAFLLYMGVTIVHSLVLRNKSRNWMITFNYLTLILDFTLICGLMTYYSFRASPDNFAHAIKNPIITYLMMPMALTVLQFRAKIVFTSLALLLLFYGSMLAFGMYWGMLLTTDWKDYVLGPTVILSEAFTKPLPFLAMACILGYSTYRAVFMVRRIGDLETRRASLARFFSPDVVEELSAGESALGPGVRQKVTVLFSDIRNFTSMSEGMDPAELAAFLTDFRNRMTDAIFECGGTLDKFVGDAIMATFGTPRPSNVPGLDSRNAVSAGLAMMKALKSLNSDRELSGLPAVGIGIGIHTGDVFCGTIGSEGRMEYTVIGDPVNTASRIESLCKFLKTNFLISQEVFAEVGDTVETEKMPRVRVKGKERPLQVYRVIVS